MLCSWPLLIAPEAENEAFEKEMKAEVFPTVDVGQQTRGGIVTAQSLLKRAFPGPENEYSWLVEWTDEGGGLRFGRDGVPPDPGASLEAFGAKTSFEKFVLVADERSPE